MAVSQLPLLRGTTEFADCENCPFSKNGLPNNPVVSEYPEDPAFLIIGEGPGRNEVIFRKPFVGQSGEIVNKMLAAVGRPRNEVGVLNSTLCLPTKDDVSLKEQASRACSARLKMELAKFPGKPILTLGAIAARAIIPKSILDAIDPPDVAPSHKHTQKNKQASIFKAEQRRARKIEKLRDKLFAFYVNEFIKDKTGESWRQEILKDSITKFPYFEKKVNKEDKVKAKEEDKKRKEIRDKRFTFIVDYIYKNHNDIHIALIKRIDKEFENATAEEIIEKKQQERLAQKQLTLRERTYNKCLAAAITKWGFKTLAKLQKENVELYNQLILEANIETDRLLLLQIQEREEQLRLDSQNNDNFLEGKQKENNKKRKKQIGINDISGTYFKVDVGDGTGERVVIPTIHPAAILHGGAKILKAHTPDLAFINIVSDAAKVNAVAKGKDIVLHFEDKVEYEAFDKDRIAELFIKFYRNAIEEGSFALDLETYVDNPEKHTALQCFAAKIRAIGLATKDHAIAVIWDLLPDWCFSLLRYLLLSKKIVKIYHNGLYDRTVLAANGFIVDSGEYFDTLLSHHATFPGVAHGLQTVTSQFFGVAAWKSEFRNNEETPEKLVKYCVKDTYSTRKIEEPLTIWLKRTGTERVNAIDKKMAEVASRMHLDGVPVDRDVNNELLTQFIKARDESKEKVEQLVTDKETLQLIWHNLALEQALKQRKTDPESFGERHKLRREELQTNYDKGKWWWKISANQHIASLLRAKGVQLTTRTDKGATKVDKEILESLIELPIVQDVLRYRENDKLISTFVWPLFDRTLKDGSTSYGYADENDRVHPIWNVHRISGRWASADPIVSNLPKAKYKKLADGTKKIIRPNIRKQYICRKGRRLIGFDFKQLEARTLALLSQDPWLCKTLADLSLDLHMEAARIIWPELDTWEESIQKQAREKAKPFEYGAFYGADPETLYKALLKEGYSILRQDVYKAYNALMGKLQGVVRFQQNIVDFACKPPYTITTKLLGRRRVFPLGHADRNECLNWPNQSEGADIMNFGMSRMIDKLVYYKDAYPILQLHDAAIFECWEDDTEELKQDVYDSFTQQYEVDGTVIPFPVDIKDAVCWADL